MTPDPELLAAYARTNSEEAFAELVRRHVNLVYSAALRQVNGDEHLARDVAQCVFTDLAGKAGSLARRESLTGWLYTSAHFAAGKIIRAETRRRDREEKFMREPTNEPAGDRASGDAWETLRPMLDQVMHELKQADREAILLRYFENRPFAEVGTRLGLNENAARMRVERALERLRTAFARRGLATTASLATVLGANAVQLAPAGLAPALTAGAITGAGTTTLTLFKIMTATKLKLALGSLVVAGAATALVVQQQALGETRTENSRLHRQLAELQSAADNVSHQPAAGSPKLTDDQFNELLKLRGEISVLRQQTGELAQARQTIQDTARRLKSAEDKAQALASAVNKFSAYESETVNAMKQAGLAMRMYANDHGDQCATNMDQLLPFLGGKYQMGAIDLGGFEFVNAGTVSLQHPDMVEMRERLARQAPDGTWSRIYGLADGSVQRATSNDGNFEAWEKVNTYSPPVGQ